jgi:hypothetical protein
MRSKYQTALLRRRKCNLARIARGVTEANHLLKLFTDHPADTYQLLLQLGGQIAFEAALNSKRLKTKLSIQTILEFSKLLFAAHRFRSRPPSRPSRKSSSVI